MISHDRRWLPWLPALLDGSYANTGVDKLFRREPEHPQALDCESEVLQLRRRANY